MVAYQRFSALARKYTIYAVLMVPQVGVIISLKAGDLSEGILVPVYITPARRDGPVRVIPLVIETFWFMEAGFSKFDKALTCVFGVFLHMYVYFKTSEKRTPSKTPIYPDPIQLKKYVLLQFLNSLLGSLL